MSAPTIINPPASGGGAPVGGSGTANTIPKWATTTTLNDSVITQSGSNIGINVAIPTQALDIAAASGNCIKLQRTSLNGFVGVITGVMTGTGNGDLAWSTTQADGGFAWKVNNNTTFAMGITETGDVGIGTTGPATKTEISGNSGVSAGGSTPIALRISATDTDGGAGTWSLTSPFTALQFYSADTSGSGASVRAQVGAVMETLSGSYSALALYTHQAGTPLERMRVSSNGNVGIGTPGPGTDLDIIKTTAGYVIGRVRNNDAGSGSYAMQVVNAYGNAWGMRIGSIAANINRLDFVEDAGGANTPRLSIAVGGNVGIGTTGPASALDVAGTITCDDAATGIKLPSSPGNSDVQVLDCYQEDSVSSTSFTTGITTTSGAITTSIVWTRVGRSVKIDITIAPAAGQSLTLANPWYVVGTGVPTVSASSPVMSICTSLGAVSSNGYVYNSGGTPVFYAFSLGSLAADEKVFISVTTQS